MNSTVTFYVTRHGETLLNQLHKAQGWADSPLTERGIQSASQLGLQLKDVQFSSVFSSDTSRALQTGKTILTAQGQNELQVITDKRLREWCLGSWEAENNDKFISSMMNELQIQNDFSELNFRLSEVHEVIYKSDITGMVEPFHMITDRLESFLKDIGDNFIHLNNPNILIVTHAFTIKTLLYLFSKEMLRKKPKIKNVDIIIIKYDGKSFSILT
ncbi:histidine phosphatase family protein [Listeria sp. FSL L7-1485]|uniref:Histidine phosphatase family protein n=1 Tax=Listeria immobilis TaxID=2713502 RepID=A0A7X1C9E3_9LIST|nr:histidine phosphatase family protein [Listeria immobilis]MBC1484428.1 histidine phosphatase family protein [Listeria immobilis]MBC1489244.1 histidine phosphatase family protein [Listeria immobilis]MBC1508043.1 histidine phosphatase family protein [Listeria immobilis]MBC1537070.1 histidine phosphatase family protein [Listeria immobilis]MBC6304340.1 histidine phosphatase family protein [Listeria immobilis]